MTDALTNPKTRPEPLTIPTDTVMPTKEGDTKEIKGNKQKRKSEENDENGAKKPKKAARSTSKGPDAVKPKEAPRPVKRSQARPHRRLDTDTIVTRLEKLKKRIDRTSTQLEDATRHAEGYTREMTFRRDEPQTDDPPGDVPDATSPSPHPPAVQSTTFV